MAAFTAAAPSVREELSASPSASPTASPVGLKASLTRTTACFEPIVCHASELRSLLPCEGEGQAYARECAREHRALEYRRGAFLIHAVVHTELVRDRFAVSDTQRTHQQLHAVRLLDGALHDLSSPRLAAALSAFNMPLRHIYRALCSVRCR